MSSEFCSLHTASDPLDIGAALQEGPGFPCKQGTQGLVGEMGWGAQVLWGGVGLGTSGVKDCMG